MAIARDTGSSSFPVISQFSDLATSSIQSPTFGTSAASTLLIVRVAWRNGGPAAAPHNVVWHGSTPAGASTWTKVTEARNSGASADQIAASIWLATCSQALVSVALDISIANADTNQCAAIAIDALTGASSTITNTGEAHSVDGSSINRFITLAGVAAGSWLFAAHTADGTAALTAQSGTTTDAEQIAGSGVGTAEVGTNSSGTSGSISVGWTGTQTWAVTCAIEVPVGGPPQVIPSFWNRYGPKLTGDPNPVSRFRTRAALLSGPEPAPPGSASFWRSWGPKFFAGTPDPINRFRSLQAFDPNAQEQEAKRKPSFQTTPGLFRRPPSDPRSRFISRVVILPTSSVTPTPPLPPPPSFWMTLSIFRRPPGDPRNTFFARQALLKGPDPAPPGSASFWRSFGPRSRFADGPVSRFRSPRPYLGAAIVGTTFMQSLAGTLTAAGNLLKQPQKVLAGTLTSSGALLKQIGKVLAGTLTSSGALLKQVQKPLAGTLTSSGALIKQIGKLFGGTLTSSGVVTIIKVALRSFAGTLSMSGSLIKQVQKPLGGTLTSAGALLKLTTKSFAGTLTSSGALLKQIGKVFAGTLTSSGVLTVIKVAIRSFAGTLTTAGTLTRQTSKALSGSLTSSGTLLRKISKGLAGTLTPAGALTKRLAKSFAGALTMAGSAVVQILAAVPAVGRALLGKTDQTALQGKADPGSLKGKDDSTSVKGRPD